MAKHTRTSDIVGYVKLLDIVVLCVVAYFLVTRGFPVWLVIISSVVLIELIIFFVLHRILFEKIAYSVGIIEINKRHMSRISGEWANFEDTGEEFVNSEHFYSGDLDIVGKKSCFQFLNTTHTWFGRQSFAESILEQKFSAEEIMRRQDAVGELSKNIDFSNNMEFNFAKIGVHASAKKLSDELSNHRIFIKSKTSKFMLMYAPVLTFIIILAALIYQVKTLYPLVGIIIFVQGMVWAFGANSQKYLGSVAGLPYKLSSYVNVIKIIKSQNFVCEKLKQLQSSLLSADRAFAELNEIADKTNVKHNAPLWYFLNIFLLWDYSCAIALEAWKNKYSAVSGDWFLALGELESLLSFSVFPNVCDNTCRPAISEKSIVAREIGHPLISNANRVNNDFHNENQIFIISGSNMSGKTTFMRTVGINLVLARAGSFVCAKEMQFFLAEIKTSMRITDDLNEGISTFYAELKRIKGIIELCETEPRTIFLIDEIFRGTNSADRLAGAKAVLAKLQSLGATGLITTHDLELCEISSEYPRIKNFSFRENFRDNKIFFDYKLNPGKSTTTNAKYLMKMVGITH
ncbi:MAG: DNA mismatch repair protein MutS [Defluviitaleaceae bacterium]|nr:DNA mismatch repair protein MutS [Defluviitaleaceae bacterium]